MAGELDPLVKALRDAASAGPGEPTRLATVNYIGAGGVNVTMDGEASASPRLYQSVATVAAGDRVAMLRVGSTWVVLGAVRRGDLTGGLWHLTPAQLIGSGVWWTLSQWYTVYQSGVTMAGTGLATVAAEGYYHLRLQVMFRNDNNSNGVRGAQITLNGGVMVGSYSAPVAAQADYVNADCATDYYLPAGAVIRFEALQNTGVGLNVHTAPFTIASIRRVG